MDIARSLKGSLILLGSSKILLRLEEFIFHALPKCVGLIDFYFLMGMLGPRKTILGSGKCTAAGFLILERTSKK
jgi:hypothetical protein